MGKSTISMAIFNGFLYVYQRVDYRNDGLLYDESGPNHTVSLTVFYRGVYLWEDEHPLLELYFHQGYRKPGCTRY